MHNKIHNVLLELKEPHEPTVDEFLKKVDIFTNPKFNPNRIEAE